MFICPKCHSSLSAKDTSRPLETSLVELKAECGCCGYKLEVIGKNDRNALEMLRNGVKKESVRIAV